ncbi:MAG: alginate lyase family protein [Trueperaceae bacterium]|nr:MAG: alginate lyase family protein [Trueperaceae bacterium]
MGDTKIEKLLKLLRTVKDIPVSQLTHRVRYEIASRAMPRLPLALREYLALGTEPKTPPLRKGYLGALELDRAITPSSKPQDGYTFDFLSEPRTLSFPIRWNDPRYSRLWQFHLHSFDWAREDLEAVYQDPTSRQPLADKASHLMHDWIDQNTFYTFDGWHPYTTSLRIVHWAFFTKAFPALATEKLLSSLWKQLRYLERHKEYALGGNHLLENLRALIVGGLLFEAPAAERMVARSVRELERQLEHQILPDGGHYERSTSYHLIVTNLVGETLACLQSAGWPEIPQSIFDQLKKMLLFAESIRLSSGAYPLWNDAAYNMSLPLDTVVGWNNKLLGFSPVRPEPPLPYLYKHLLTSSTNPSNPKFDVPSSKPGFAPHTGYFLLRNKRGFELGFDCAPPCPKELPGHAHADCLTIDVYYKGKPIVVDTGTSQYQGGAIRNFERSTPAHNTITLDGRNQSEVWGSFRVGRKAMPRHVRYGKEGGWDWVSAAHDGYAIEPLFATHHRWVGLGPAGVLVLDRLESERNVAFVSNFHFAPGLTLEGEAERDTYRVLLNGSALYLTIFGLSPQDDHAWLEPEISNSWHAPIMGRRHPRGTLRIKGSTGDSRFRACGMLLSRTVIVDIGFEWHDEHGRLVLGDEILTWSMRGGSLTPTSLGI